ncbi:hypothetical protein KP509_08G023900 [Ceratopteris richardii]|uniref:Uncharacterized protein n=1 Tax=Ceratopteris richardii TaxID=49495 RepID=A0A8T2UBQ5_CERRI|nr:hypothetical protein KP509_08G023900 [Ceratopteris richardii]KAH7430995.1 hypothetical protein KP509_08G023900 [Ceratopteris richardii]
MHQGVRYVLAASDIVISLSLPAIILEIGSIDNVASAISDGLSCRLQRCCYCGAAIGELFVGLLTDYGLRSHQRSAVPMSRALCEQTCMGSFSETTHCQLLCFASHFMIAESL